MWRKWKIAIMLFVVPMALLDTHFLMPNYLPNDAQSMHNENWPLPFLYIESGLKYFLAPFTIAHTLFYNGLFQFGYATISTYAASAIVMLVFFVPFLVFLTFILEDQTGIPPAYYVFQFFITRSGAEQMDAASGSVGRQFGVTEFNRRVVARRADKHQAKLEAKELRAATKRARSETAKFDAKSARLAAAEEKRIRAAEEALTEMETNHRSKSRFKARRKLWRGK